MTTLQVATHDLAQLIRRGISIEQVHDTEVNDEGNPVMTFGQQITVLDGPCKGRTLVMWRYQSFLAFSDQDAAEVAGDLFGVAPAALMAAEQSRASSSEIDFSRWVAAIQAIWRQLLGMPVFEPLVILPSISMLVTTE